MPVKALHIGPGFDLPLEAVTQTFGFLGKRGVGKTHGAAVIAEEMLAHALQVVVIDPIGVWWGLRSSADGRSKGHPILVLGGEHGDLPLAGHDGKLIAGFVVSQAASVVLDLGTLSKSDQARFVTDFLEHLYQQNRAPLHLIIDEADAFAPQRIHRGAERCFGAVDTVVRRGRARGLGVTLVTQRSAAINKDVLTQIEVLVAFRTIAPQDRAALEAWIEAHGTPAEKAELLAGLAKLEVGEAWWWSPAWLQVFRRVQIRRRRTFDSSATPKVGQTVREPRAIAAVDIESMRSQLGQLVEKAEAEDPARLRRRIADLERELKKKTEAPRAAARPPEVVRVQVPTLKEADIKRLEAVAARCEELARTVGSAIGPASSAPVYSSRHVIDSRPAQTDRPRPAAASAPPATEQATSASAKRILDALAWLEALGIAPAEKTQIALLAGQSPTSGGYFNNLGRLRTLGLIDYPGPGRVLLTDKGRRLASTEGVPQTDRELHEQLYARLPKSQAAILRALVEHFPREMAKNDLAEQTGQSPTSGGYFNNLGRLRTLGLIDYPGPGRVVALPVLFMERSA